MALMAQTVLRFYRGQAQAKQIAIRLVAPARGLRALADRNSVLVVVDNLVSNAIKYSPAGRPVTVCLSAEKGAVRLAVEDHGPGIGAEDLGKLFGRFVKLDAQPTGGEHSTGLGLYIVKNYVRMMKGKVWVESEKGRGSTFFVELPRVEARTRSLRARKRSRRTKRIGPLSTVGGKS
jgi:signal transduction histidine kinase